MFANHSFKQSAAFGILSVLLISASPVYGWQDFPSFDEMMREADLPKSGRVSNQPVSRPESAWPITVPAGPLESRTERFSPSNRRDLQGIPAARSSWPDQPSDRSRLPAASRNPLAENSRTQNPRTQNPRTQNLPTQNRADQDFWGRQSRPSVRGGTESDLERFQPTRDQSSTFDPIPERNPLNSDAGYSNSGYPNGPSPNAVWPPEASQQIPSSRENGSRPSNAGRVSTGGRNSDLLDPFGFNRNQPATNGATGRQPAANTGSSNFMTLPPTGNTSSQDFIRPAGQSRPVAAEPAGIGFQDFESRPPASQDRRSFGFSQDGNSKADRELDANFRDSSSSTGSLPGDLDDEYPSATSDDFDWRTIRVSVGDIILPGNTIFQHAESVLSIPEENAYLDLIQDIENRKTALMQDPSLTGLSTNARLAVWEESFYEFTKARQLAFDNGKLRHESKAARLRNDLVDPFGKKVDQRSLTSRTDYLILDDIRRYPDHFTGRPIVLSGMFSPESDRTMSRTDGALDPTITTVEEDPAEPVVNRSAVYGMVYDSENRLSKATVTTGSLLSFDGGELLATIDSSSLTTPLRGVQDIRSAWRNLPPFPVLIKGWVVKKFKGDRPLIYCESMRLLSPEPHRSLVQSHTYDKQKIRSEEKWLYYETLQQMNQTRLDMQQELGRQNVVQRIDSLQSEIIDKFKEDALALKAEYSANKVSQSEYEKQLGSLNRQFQMRKSRHQKYRSETELFPTYVDLFQNHDKWHGKIVTLKGHVRHTVTYAADKTMYDGRQLCELWLFTEDSQHTPAVILTPELPADFPMDAELVNQVSVTGCFFKRYVYTGQAERRIAPLILAGTVQWAPTVSHVASLVKDGDLSAGSPLAVRAKALESKQSGNAALIFISLVIIFGLMVLWGRAQREERDRLRLRDRIVDVKEIENGTPPEFASATDEYLNRIRVR